VRIAGVIALFGALVAPEVFGQGPAPTPTKAPAQSGIQIHVDTRGAREILLTLGRPKWEPTDAKLLEDIPAIAQAIQDSNRPAEIFERDLKAAFETESRVAVFDFRSVRDSLTRWQGLVGAISSREAELSKMAALHAQELLPTDLPAPARVEVRLSFGLAGLADHIVSRNPDGGEVIVVDLARALGESEGEPLEARMSRLARLIAGGAFRQAWANYRSASPAWRRPEPALGLIEPLIRVVAEAGPVALFAVDEAFFPLSTWLRGLQRKAFFDLQREAERIAASETELDRRVEVMSELRQADFARRVAAPAGMFMADAIRQVAGVEGLKVALSGGPRFFFESYDRAVQKNKELPPVPKLIHDKLATVAKPAPKP
jgi:putative zinc-dependent peptidase DUF5700